MAEVATTAKKIIANVENVIVGKRSQIVLSLVSWFCEGHILLEDVPGVSRGPSGDPGVYRNKTATEAFVAETVAGAEYLKAICRDLGIGVE